MLMLKSVIRTLLCVSYSMDDSMRFFSASVIRGCSAGVSAVSINQATTHINVNPPKNYKPSYNTYNC